MILKNLYWRDNLKNDQAQVMDFNRMTMDRMTIIFTVIIRGDSLQPMTPVQLDRKYLLLLNK